MFQQKKVRKFFPRKGPEKKALMFLSNLSRIPAKKRKAVYTKVLKSKSPEERRVLVKARKVFSSRRGVFRTFSSLVERFRAEEPSFQGVIIFGGVVKKDTPPTDLDFIFVGHISDRAKASFCDELYKSTGIPANPFPIKIDLSSDPRIFDKLISVPYLHFPEEWTVQNFVGPLSVKRALMKSYKGAFKRVKPYRSNTR